VKDFGYAVMQSQIQLISMYQYDCDGMYKRENYREVGE
jgi:hypothetical protein